MCRPRIGTFPTRVPKELVRAVFEQLICVPLELVPRVLFMSPSFYIRGAIRC